MDVVSSTSPPAARIAASAAPAGSAGVGAKPATAHDAKLKETARQFEAMFMTEMLRHARPENKASGAFAAGSGEGSWSVLMDQALGQVATANGPAGDGRLRQTIEKALRDADARSGRGAVR